MSKTLPDLVRDSAYGKLIESPMYPNVAQKVSIVGTPNRNSTDLTSVVIELAPSVSCYYALGGASVVASPSGESSHFIPALTSKRINSKDHTRVAVCNFTSGEIGSLHITELI